MDPPLQFDLDFIGNVCLFGEIIMIWFFGPQIILYTVHDANDIEGKKIIKKFQTVKNTGKQYCFPAWMCFFFRCVDK